MSIQNSASLVEKIVGAENFEKCKELSGYLEDSFGNSQRVDYGTGHETTFFVFLCCLYKALVLQRSELPATILLVFPAYLKVCRHLQTVYWLEPAGSHGVWCLDDYQLLPFVFGSAQLIGRRLWAFQRQETNRLGRKVFWIKRWWTRTRRSTCIWRLSSLFALFELEEGLIVDENGAIAGT